MPARADLYQRHAPPSKISGKSRRDWRVPEARKGQEYKSLQTNVNEADESILLMIDRSSAITLNIDAIGCVAFDSSSLIVSLYVQRYSRGF
jgi:hypothetical protein